VIFFATTYERKSFRIWILLLQSRLRRLERCLAFFFAFESAGDQPLLVRAARDELPPRHRWRFCDYHKRARKQQERNCSRFHSVRVHKGRSVASDSWPVVSQFLLDNGRCDNVFDARRSTPPEAKRRRREDQDSEPNHSSGQSPRPIIRFEEPGRVTPLVSSRVRIICRR